MAPTTFSRKSDGLQSTRSSTRRPNTQSAAQNNASNIGRKRPRDSSDNEEHTLPLKKARFAVEILSKSQHLLKAQPLIITATTDSAILDTPVKSEERHSPAPATPSAHTKLATTPTKAKQTIAKLPTPKKPVNHHEKVVNGIKHELDRLGANLTDQRKVDEKRSLRSAEGSRFKSDLSLYFPDYDEVIGNEPKEQHILELDTPIIIVDNAKTAAKQHQSYKTNGHALYDEYSVKDFPESLFTDLHQAERVDFSFLEAEYDDVTEENDPLSDAYFESIHRKPERLEKTIRNTDRGRAQHEKDQIIRLLEGLQGHDWLKVLGVSGITESKKKDYEPARDHYINGCEMILDKFRIWKDEEKRRKLEKEQAMAAEAEEEDDEGNDNDPPDYGSDVDASAARQLHDEAVARSTPLHGRKRHRVELAPEYETEQREFTSFFPKRHLRDAALSQGRRTTRSAVAWGHPVPDSPEKDFQLPEDMLDKETLKGHARRKRRERRVSKEKPRV